MGALVLVAIWTLFWTCWVVACFQTEPLGAALGVVLWALGAAAAAALRGRRS